MALVGAWPVTIVSRLVLAGTPAYYVLEIRKENAKGYVSGSA